MESTQKEEGFSEQGSIDKCCSDCKTKKTPMWRSGPSGPKSLCNACGIKYRKKMPPDSADTGSAKNDAKAKRKMKLKSGLNVSLMGVKTRRRRQWGEVERAALLLMALSCGAVFS